MRLFHADVTFADVYLAIDEVDIRAEFILGELKQA